MKLYKIKKSGIDNKGRGLYATRDIKKGTKIIDYLGKLITKKQTEESDKYDNGKPIYLFTINKKYDLDGDFKFNTARLINHSCDPNCEVFGSGLNSSNFFNTRSNTFKYSSELIPAGKGIFKILLNLPLSCSEPVPG